MIKNCSGVTVHGKDCKRPAVKDSDFCYFHKKQEKDTGILGKINDIYMCPNSCEELNYWHRYGKPCYTCSECNGVLLNEKHDFKDLILKLPRSDDLSLAQLGCPTCSSSDYSDRNSYSFSVFVYRWLEVKKRGMRTVGRINQETDICFCNNCESIWIPNFRTTEADYWPSKELLSTEKQNYLLAEKELGDMYVSPIDEIKKDLQQREEEEGKILNDYGINCIFIDSKGKRCLRPRISGEVYCFVHRNLVEDDKDKREIVEKTAFGSKLWFTENMAYVALVVWLGIVFTFNLNSHFLDIVADSNATNSDPIGVAVVSFGFFIWPLFVNYKKLIEKI